MKTLKLATLLALAALFLCSLAISQQSGRQFRRSAIMNGNQVRTVFGNWGVIGQPADQGHRGAWQNDNNGYLGDVSPLVGAEVKFNGKVFHSVVTSPVDRPTQLRDEDPVTNKPWTFEPVGGYFNANQQRVALSTDESTWPPAWPDKLTDASDPGWKGQWNGYFGKRISADEETYYVMDDNNDERFNIASNNTIGVAFKPDAANTSRNGLGLVMSVRGMQWSSFLAKDNIFWLYEITNTGTTTYDRAVFGMLVGTYVGVTSTENYQEYADDWSFYDVKTNVTYTGDFGRAISNPLWVGPVGMVGYAFLESPGNPFDGIDNDGDADSSLIGRGASQFVPSDFDTISLTPGRQIVLIDNDYSRHLFTIPNLDSVQITTRGLTQMIYPGRTRVVEGNVLRDVQGNEAVNANAYDGVDNNFNGLIDENINLHYRQLKRTRAGVVLIDILRPVRHSNYFTGAGTTSLSMIDERRNDLVDNNQDWIQRTDDLGRDGVPQTGDFGEADGQPTSGYDANGNDTGLPGEPHIDKTDVRESDQIGLTSFFYFAPSNQVRLGDDESLWKNLQPGFFDVPPSIVNNKPQAGEDGDFIYGSGYFPLQAKTTERFSLALVFGGGKGGGVDADVADMLKNKLTVQKIYDANYQFPQPPDRPTLRVVPGDRMVTLYWDRTAEGSVDPVLQVKDFEGYKIYKSTLPDFADINVITDGSGDKKGFKPLAQFDLVDGVQGYFQTTGELYQSTGGFAYYMGTDNGLQHSFVDTDVENGRKYYYAVVAYDKGDAFLSVLPSENNFRVRVTTAGEFSFPTNVGMVTPNTKVAGYVTPGSGVPLSHLAGLGTGAAMYNILNPAAVTGHTYRVEFLDTQVDGIDNNGNGLIDAGDPSEWERQTSMYSVRDLATLTETFTAQDTVPVKLNHQNLIPSTVVVTTPQGTVIAPAVYRLDAARGSIRGTTPGALPAGNYVVTFQYYPVYHSPNVQGTPFLTDSRDADAFDGLQLAFANSWVVSPVDSLSKWVGKTPYNFAMTPLFTQDPGPPVQTFRGYRNPSNYSIIFSNTMVDTSYSDPLLYPFPVPVNFRILNESENTYIKFIFADGDGNGVLSPQDELVFVENSPRGALEYTWDIKFSNKQGEPIDTVYTLTTGDKLVLRTSKPFRLGDEFEFTPVLPKVDVALEKADVLRVHPVPNPYVTAAEFEAPLNPGITSGRGERRIDFVHTPVGATIQIFTARGEHVVTLRHESTIEDGTVSWNLKTKENLDIAYGVYFYVVESPAGNKTGKLAIIK